MMPADSRRRPTARDPLFPNDIDMLTALRSKASSWIIKILFLLLIGSFGVWGVGDMLRVGGSSTEIAHVGGTHIPIYGWVGGSSVTANQVRDQFNLQLDNIQRQTGQRPEPEQALRFGLHVRALEEVIQRAVLDYTIQQFGLVVSDAPMKQSRSALSSSSASSSSPGFGVSRTARSTSSSTAAYRSSFSRSAFAFRSNS